MTVLVRGGTTNKSFLLDLLDRPEVRRRRGSTRPGSTGSPRPASTCPRATPTSPSSPPRSTPTSCRPRSIAPRSSAGRAAGRPQADARRRPRRSSCATAASPYRVDRPARSGRPGTRSSSTASTRARRRRAAGARPQPADDRRAQRSASSRRSQGSDHLVEVDGVAHRFSRDDAGIVRAPVVGPRGRRRRRARTTSSRSATRLAVVEAMKMEIAIPAPLARPRARRVRGPQRAGRRRRAAVPDRAGRRRRRSDAGRGAADDRPGCVRGRGDRRRPIEIVRAFVLGFDVDPARARRAGRQRLDHRTRRAWGSSTRSPTSARSSPERQRHRRRRP